MSELKTSLKIGSARWVLTGVGGGAGVAVGIAAIRALTARPEFLPQLVNGGFLGFAALMVGMVIVRAELRDFNANHLRSVVASEKQAASMSALASKDDYRERRVDLLIGEMTRVSENNAASLKRIESWIDGQSKTS